MTGKLWCWGLRYPLVSYIQLIQFCERFRHCIDPQDPTVTRAHAEDYENKSNVSLLVTLSDQLFHESTFPS